MAINPLENRRLRSDGWDFENIAFDPTEGHWLWVAGLNENGYGPYRVFYRVWGGYPAPKAPWTLDHKCRVRNCVNPWHLVQVTHKQNVRNGVAYRITHPRPWIVCGRGHPHSYSREYWAIENDKLARKCLNCLAEDKPLLFSWAGRVKRILSPHCQ